jgi:putative ABC transport system substrate-binding protein
VKRRTFIAGLGSTVAWHHVARAQQPALPVIGFLDSTSAEATRDAVAGFPRGMKEAGYVDGQNVAIEFRWADGQFDHLPALAGELVRRRVSLIVASGAVGAALAAKDATSTIPIVFVGGADPVKYGVVASLNRPGGNITGVTSILNELAGKQLDLLRELVPQATTFGYLVGNQGSETERDLTNDLLRGARALGREVIVLECRRVSDFEAAFETLVQRRASALLVSAFPIAFNNRPKILALAAHHRIPAIYAQGSYAHEGGLMAYGASIMNQFRLAGIYVGRILKGEKPADLPVQQPTKFELVVNLKTAKALGLTIPETLLATADEVIQ